MEYLSMKLISYALLALMAFVAEASDKEAAIRQNNFALVAGNLGYQDSRFLSRPANNAHQMQGNVHPWPFYAYLYCLSHKYKGYVFQMYEVRMEDASRQLTIDLYSDRSASDNSHAARIRIGRSNMGYYAAMAEDYESGMDKRSQYQGLVTNLFNRCQMEILGK